MTMIELIRDADLSTGLPEVDPIEVLAATERADWALMVMVCCAGLATLVLAAAVRWSRDGFRAVHGAGTGALHTA